jgi:UDP-GlcNAc:undecaprenyl-phosphate/decaprenyl-phosphate GlcNAc-1-phosphate transferase
MYLITAFFVGMLVCFLTTKAVNHSRFASLVIDIPNYRSLHLRPTPRTGGIGISAGLIFSVVVTECLFHNGIATLIPTLLAFAALVGISIVDDAKQLTAKIRLSFHLVVILAWFAGSDLLLVNSSLKGLTGPSMALLSVVVVLGIAWATNLFNFMDGSDGLAGCMALVAFATYAAAVPETGDRSLTLMCVAACGALLSFLYFNWPKASIFLGDSGSISLGFLGAAIGTIGVFKGYWAADFPLMIYAMFWVDATFTLVSRYFKGKKLGVSHRDHWYQRAIQGGNSHLKILTIHLLCNIVICALAVYSLKSKTYETHIPNTLIIVLILLIAFGFGIWAEIQHKNRSPRQTK